jgi:putative FmdB family regulatory protein
MPIYEYVCPDCGLRFELLRSATRMNDLAPCPSGHKGGRRVLSAFATVTGGADAESYGGDSQGFESGGCGGGCGDCACG